MAAALDNTTLETLLSRLSALEAQARAAAAWRHREAEALPVDSSLTSDVFVSESPDPSKEPIFKLLKAYAGELDTRRDLVVLQWEGALQRRDDDSTPPLAESLCELVPEVVSLRDDSAILDLSRRRGPAYPLQRVSRIVHQIIALARYDLADPDDPIEVSTEPLWQKPLLLAEERGGESGLRAELAAELARPSEQSAVRREVDRVLKSKKPVRQKDEVREAWLTDERIRELCRRGGYSGQPR